MAAARSAPGRASFGSLVVVVVVLLAVVVTASVLGCDNRQAVHELEPGLERMQLQPKVVPYASPMRRPPSHTVAWGRGDDGDGAGEGEADASHVERIPVPVTRALLTRGRADFDRVCATCHGILGDGVSVVADKMELRRPPSLHEPRLRALAPGMLFTIITRGYGLMPAYAGMLDAEDRWAVVGYVQALQLSQSAKVADLPLAVRAALAREAP
jgi:mono/diheme cytochrome c family protein